MLNVQFQFKQYYCLRSLATHEQWRIPIDLILISDTSVALFVFVSVVIDIIIV